MFSSALNNWLADGGEGVAVDGTRADGFNLVAVELGTVPFVLSKAVGGITAVLLDHEAVAGDFGEDGGGGNAQTFAVAANDGLLGQVDGFEANTAVYQQIFGRWA